jgi:hypothetical protein
MNSKKIIFGFLLFFVLVNSRVFAMNCDFIVQSADQKEFCLKCSGKCLICSICLNDVCIKKDKDHKIQTPCGHIFHSDCLSTWLSCNDTCPMCRKKIPDFIFQKHFVNSVVTCAGICLFLVTLPFKTTICSYLFKR